VSREAVVAAAEAELGADTHEKRIKYWESALGRKVTYAEIAKPAWCGIFALYCLHTADLALDKLWRFGRGFLLVPPHPMLSTKNPLPGDIGYQDQPFQHHFVVTSVAGDVVSSVDGNQPDIRRRVRSAKHVTAFYSIGQFLPADTIPSPAPRPATPAEVQHGVNNLVIKHLLEQDTPKILTVDGIIGPRSTHAIGWAQRKLGLPVNNDANDLALQKALGL